MHGSKEPCMTNKEAYMTNKEAYMTQKEPYITQKEPYMTHKEPLIALKRDPLTRARLQINRAHGHVMCGTATNICVHTINATLIASTPACLGVVAPLALAPSSEEEGEVLVSGWCSPQSLHCRHRAAVA